MLATFPHARALVLVCLAGVLALMAGALIGIATASHTSHQRAASNTSATSARATPGSTAHARVLYRSSLGR